MALAVQVLGGILALAGLVGLVIGVDMLPTERGIAWTISSTTTIVGGVITAAIGLGIDRLERILAALGGAAPRTSRPTIEPALAQVQPQAPAAPVADMPSERPVMRIDPGFDAPVAAPPLVAITPPAATQAEKAVERPRFSLPSIKLGGAMVAAGATVAAAGAALSRTRDDAARVVEAALDDLKKSARPEPVDPPVEVLQPVDDEAPPVAAALPPVAVALPEPVYADVPMPAEEPAAALEGEPEPESEPEPAPEPAAAPVRPVAKDDPLAAFEEELDRLIPLRPARGKKSRKDGKAEPVAEAPVDMPAEETPLAAPLAEPEIAAPAEPPRVVEPVDAEPQPVAPEPAAPEAPPAAPSPEVVGAYESGGAKYTMFSDGSVVAEAEGQTLYFKSLEELREFIDGGAKLA